MKNLLIITLVFLNIHSSAQTATKEDRHTLIFSSVIATAGAGAIAQAVTLYLKPVPVIYNLDGTENADKLKANFNQQKNNSILIASGGVFLTFVSIMEFRSVIKKNKKLNTSVSFNSIKFTYTL